VIGSLGALYLNMDYNIYDEVDPKEINVAQKEKIINSMQSKFQSKIAVYAYLLFILLYFPCISTFAILAKEFSYKWAFISMVWSTSIAYFVAALFYQVGRLVAL
jgi:ferrous iron transport protein B